MVALVDDARQCPLTPGFGGPDMIELLLLIPEPTHAAGENGMSAVLAEVNLSVANR